jgi:hypothetical protein
MPPLQEQVLTSSTVPGDVKFKAGALLGACGNKKRSRLDADATFSWATFTASGGGKN